MAAEYYANRPALRKEFLSYSDILDEKSSFRVTAAVYLHTCHSAANELMAKRKQSFRKKVQWADPRLFLLQGDRRLRTTIRYANGTRVLRANHRVKGNENPRRFYGSRFLIGLPMATHNTGSHLHTWANCQWAATIRDDIACETITGQGGWMEEVLLLDGSYIKDSHIRVTDKPGLGADLHPDVVKAHLAIGEPWWE